MRNRILPWGDKRAGEKEIGFGEWDWTGSDAGEERREETTQMRGSEISTPLVLFFSPGTRHPCSFALIFIYYLFFFFFFSFIFCCSWILVSSRNPVIPRVPVFLSHLVYFPNFKVQTTTFRICLGKYQLFFSFFPKSLY